MKVKKLMFSGFMAAILTGIACSADAAVVASKEYVDARETSILGTVEQTYQKSKDALDEITAVVGTEESGLIKDVADNTKEISNLKAKDTELAGKIQANSDAIAILEGGEGAEGSIANLTTKINDNASAIQTLNGDGEGSVANKISTALTNYSTSTQVDGKISTALENYSTSDEVTTAISNASSALTNTLTTEINKKQNEITGDQLKALNSGITVEKVANYDNYATTKQDVMSAGNDYVTVANNKVSVNVDGAVAANNTGLVTGGAVYTYALPKPTACEETTCVLSVNRNGQPYWMKLELATGGSTEPTNE